MSDVVLRCPNCGTTRETAGECEACHEAQVKYFCPNHSPGRWLDGPVCAECEAREVREAREKRATPPVVRDTPKRGSEWSPRRERPAPAPPRVEIPRVDVPRVEDWRDHRRRVDPDVPRPAPPITWRVELPPGMRAVPVAGCLKRLAMLVVIGLVLFGVATCWFFGSVFQLSSSSHTGGDHASSAIVATLTHAPATSRSELPHAPSHAVSRQ